MEMFGKSSRGASVRRPAEFDKLGGKIMGQAWQGIIAIVICEPGNTRWGERRGGAGYGTPITRHGYTADLLETRPFLCGIAVAWLRVVVSPCVWHGMTRENGEGDLPAQKGPTNRLCSNVISTLHQTLGLQSPAE
jgi:hypothetical protein